MKNRILQMAWRNCWRNKRRTLITVSSIFFAIFFAIIMRSFELGTYDNMIKQSIEMFSGYIQVQGTDYFDDPSLDNSMPFDQDLIDKISKTEGVKIAVPRVETFALASSGLKSKGVLITGIDPDREAKISNPEHLIIHYQLTPQIISLFNQTFKPSKKLLEALELHQNSGYNNLGRLELDLGLKSDEFNLYRDFFEKEAFFEGKYLQENDNGVLISYKLAKFLNIQVNDTLVLIGQGFQGSSAAGLFPVRGIIKVPAPDLDNKLVYMTLNKANEFLALENRITSIVINLNDTDEMHEVQHSLISNLDDAMYSVKNWEELNKILKQQIEGDSKSGQMFIGILYVLIFFGIFGTVIMMVTERKREFGVLIAIGMGRRLLAMVVVTEMFIIGLIGTLSGMLASIPLIIFFNINPIRITGQSAKIYEDMGFDPVMPTATIDHYFTWQALIILIMVMAACYIPLQRIRRMKIIDALKA